MITTDQMANATLGDKVYLIGEEPLYYVVIIDDSDKTQRLGISTTKNLIGKVLLKAQSRYNIDWPEPNEIEKIISVRKEKLNLL